MCVGFSLPFKQHEEDILLGAEVLHRGRPSTNLTPKDVVEDLGHIFFTLVTTDKAYATFDKAKVNVEQNTQKRLYSTLPD